MPEWHHVLQEEATPGDASAFAPVELPTLESIFTRSGKLKGNAFRSAPRLRVVLAALVSISAVVFLVFFCSRVYGRRALQEFGGRGLASSEDSDEEVDVCGFSSDEEEQQPHVRPRVSLPAVEEQHLPLKKRLLSRAGEAVPRGVEPPPRQQEQQQQDDEVVSTWFRSSPPEAPSGPEQHGPSSFPAPTPLSSAQMRTLPDLDAAARQLAPRPLQRAARRRASGRRRSIFVEFRRLQRQIGRLQQQVYLLQRQQWQQLGPPKERRHRKQQEEHFKQRHKQRDPYQERWHLFWGQQQQQYWFQPHQQQPVQLQQPALQEQMQQQVQQHSMQDREQEQLFEVQELQQVTPDYGEQQAMQEEERQGPPQVREEQRHQLKRKREEQEEPDPSEEEQQQLLPPVDPLAGQLMIDEWIDPESTSREVPQPSTSQEALQPPAAPAAPGPWRSEYFRRQVMAGLPLAAPYASGATRSQASRDEDAAASGADAAAASAASALPSAGVSSAAPAPTGDVTREETLSLTSILARLRAEGVRTASDARIAAATAIRLAAAGGTKAAAGETPGEAGEITAAAGETGETAAGEEAGSSTPTSRVSQLLETPTTSISAMLQHPFVRLPKAVLGASMSSISVDLRRALDTPPRMRCGVPLLQRAHALLSQDVLVADQLKELAKVAQEIVAHLIRFEGQDLSGHQNYRAVVRLGIRFLLLDAVVSALLILEQTPDENDWKLVTDAISDAAPEPFKRAGATDRTSFALALGQELSSAIQILKTGRRPVAARLLRIKRMMFCFPWSPGRFKHDEFEAWRRQCNGGTDGP